MSILDNPIWQALSSDSLTLGEGDDLAKRFLPSVGPLAGMINQSQEAYRSLSRLAKPQEQLVLFLPEPAVLPSGWVMDADGLLVQMVFEGQLEQPLESPLGTLAQGLIEPLTDADIPDMLELTHLTKPGPFRQRTNELGLYLGIREQNRLVAMAGERLKLPGYVEVSAVCTHPDFQGKGYAQALVLAVMLHIQGQGKVPFLHTGSGNTRAIRVYEKLGFRTRRMLHLAVIRQL